MNLENLNVAELSAQEVRETEGGILPLLCIAVEVGCYALAGDILLNLNTYAEQLEDYVNEC